ncbi:lecithin retinol acyltransferase family protein [Paenibacillus sp. FSL H7-0716]|uniref:LRAT domain-containing protein n=1 Tax=Paenibacillus odorifer TaxID=189426 RepID=A0AB36J8S3_9BACL|nr:lecithin retinol acyltransferase family protein [Paenibacillus odorifer]OME16590.1 hypothetical protein BSK47_20240 [Paenibacillus odorifer]
MDHPLLPLVKSIQKTARTVFNAVESIQTAPRKATHAFLGNDPVLERGDHIAVYYGYLHHGIYVGNGLVIHYTKINGHGIVSLDTLDTFKQGKAIEKRSSSLRCSRDEVVKRAHKRLGESNYNLIYNNCEHFVVSCRG